MTSQNEPYYWKFRDPKNWDFIKADLYVDGLWWDLDLSHIVPDKAGFVIMTGYIVGRDTGILYIRGPGREHGYNSVWATGLNSSVLFSFTVSCSPGSMVEYRAKDLYVGHIGIAVSGYLYPIPEECEKNVNTTRIIRI